MNLRQSQIGSEARSVFYNGGSAIAVPETEGAAGGGGRIYMSRLYKDFGYIYNEHTPRNIIAQCARPQRGDSSLTKPPTLIMRKMPMISRFDWGRGGHGLALLAL